MTDEMADHESRRNNIIMESLNKLRMLEEKFKKVVVVHDMTPKERQECKETVSYTHLTLPTKRIV